MDRRLKYPEFVQQCTTLLSGCAAMARFYDSSSIMCSAVTTAYLSTTDELRAAGRPEDDISQINSWCTNARSNNGAQMPLLASNLATLHKFASSKTCSAAAKALLLPKISSCLAPTLPPPNNSGGAVVNGLLQDLEGLEGGAPLSALVSFCVEQMVASLEDLRGLSPTSGAVPLTSIDGAFDLRDQVWESLGTLISAGSWMHATRHGKLRWVLLGAASRLDMALFRKNFQDVRLADEVSDRVAAQLQPWSQMLEEMCVQLAGGAAGGANAGELPAQLVKLGESLEESLATLVVGQPGAS